ncbi:MAG TPA: dipeptide epimerase [Candidatus Limnocylindrales bacterium]|jgi:L-alanine-DL-glutamate epimerase-like enolase superfamily enzyme
MASGVSRPTSELDLTHEVLHLTLRDPFLIARSDHDAGHAVTTIVVELRDERFPGLVGLGEGYPDRFYGEKVETMAAIFPYLLTAVTGFEPSIDGVRVASDRLQHSIRWNGGAKCAIDTAIHDLAGKVAGLPVHRLLGLSTDIPPTDFTLGLDEPSIVAERAKRAGAFPALKIKCGGPADIATLEAVRAVYDRPLRVDANTGWTPEIARQLLPALIDLGVELIEQPFPAGRLDWLRDLQAGSPLPIVADESCVTIDDLDALVGVTAGVNVKLAKCGGPGPAAQMLARAHELGFRTFLGCMEETSVAIAASAAVASLADWVDLDGNLLLAAEPFTGLVLGPDHRWQLTDVPGLGVSRAT